jgi:hypothetical protein
VHLGNTIPKLKNLLFLDQADADIMMNYFEPTIFHKVIYHELLGHGSGKLF